METVLTMWIAGHPVPQGSMIGFKQGNAVRVQPSNKKALMAWRKTIAVVAGKAQGDRPPLNEPVTVHASFYFQRPAAHYYSGRNAEKLKPTALEYPTGRGNGDVDKLTRALLDGLDEAGVFTDDCRVRSIHIGKQWAEIGEPEGVRVVVAIDSTPRCTTCNTTQAEWRQLRAVTKDPRSCCSSSSHEGQTTTGGAG